MEISTPLTDDAIFVVKRWPEFAARAQISDTWREQIGGSQRLAFAAP